MGCEYKIYFTKRAYTQLAREVEEYPYYETGGILIGKRIGRNFFVFESIDPGFDAFRSRGEFRRQYDYVTHLAYVIAGLYEGDATLVGYWHRHPSGYDRFSSGDVIVNNEFADLYYGTVSGLVNIDPAFRTQFWYISPSHEQIRCGEIEVGDEVFRDIMVLKDSGNVIRHINAQDQDTIPGRGAASDRVWEDDPTPKAYKDEKDDGDGADDFEKKKRTIVARLLETRNALTGKKAAPPAAESPADQTPAAVAADRASAVAVQPAHARFNISRHTFSVIKPEIDALSRTAKFEFKGIDPYACRLIIRSADGGIWAVRFEYEMATGALNAEYYERFRRVREAYSPGLLGHVIQKT